MEIFSDEYKEKVLDDIRNYASLNHPVSVNFFQRVLTRKAAKNKLHPNPEDEFSMPSIGPNYEIVSNYETEFRRLCAMDEFRLEEPLCVQKMTDGIAY